MMWLVVPLLLACVGALVILGVLLWIEEKRYGKQRQNQQSQESSASAS